LNLGKKSFETIPPIHFQTDKKIMENEGVRRKAVAKNVCRK
jgi:hypothetical protein